MTGGAPLRYEFHAKLRMAQRNVSQAEVERTIAFPSGTYYAPAKARTSYFGQTDDGRDLEVVVHHDRGVIVTIIA